MVGWRNLPRWTGSDGLAKNPEQAYNGIMKKLSLIEQRRLAGRKSAEARGKKGSKKYIAYYKALSKKGNAKRWNLPNDR